MKFVEKLEELKIWCSLLDRYTDSVNEQKKERLARFIYKTYQRVSNQQKISIPSPVLELINTIVPWQLFDQQYYPEFFLAQFWSTKTIYTIRSNIDFVDHYGNNKIALLLFEFPNFSVAFYVTYPHREYLQALKKKIEKRHVDLSIPVDLHYFLALFNYPSSQHNSKNLELTTEQKIFFQTALYVFIMLYFRTLFEFAKALVEHNRVTFQEMFPILLQIEEEEEGGEE